MDQAADELAPLLEMAVRIQSALVERGLTLATAESCTGGLIGYILTETSGSSAYYVGGLISYSNDMKEQELGVDARTLDKHGAVSAQTCVAMAEGARQRYGRDNQGGVGERPADVVLAALARGRRGFRASSHSSAAPFMCSCENPDERRERLSGFGDHERRDVADRHGNRVRSAEAALALLLERLGVESQTV